MKNKSKTNKSARREQLSLKKIDAEELKAVSGGAPAAPAPRPTMTTAGQGRGDNPPHHSPQGWHIVDNRPPTQRPASQTDGRSGRR